MDKGIWTIENFKKLNIPSILVRISKITYSHILQELIKEANSKDASEPELVQILNFFGGLFWCWLNPENENEPYQYLRLEVITPDQLKFIDDILPHIKDPHFCARLADIKWLASGKRDRNAALKAIRSFSAVGYDEENFLIDGIRCWERGWQLAAIFKGKKDLEFKEEEKNFQKIINDCLDSTNDNISICLNLINLILKFNPVDKARLEDIIGKLNSILAKNEIEGHGLQRILETIIDIYNKADLKNQANCYRERLAEHHASIAKRALDSLNGNPLLARAEYNRALEIYRALPKNEKINQRYNDIQLLAQTAGEVVLTELKEHRVVIETKELEEILTQVEQLEVNNFEDAMYNLCNCHHINISKLKQMVQDTRENRTLSDIFTTYGLTHDGRNSFKYEGGNQIAKDEEALYRYYTWDIQTVVECLVLPILCIINAQHRFTKKVFIELAQGSCIVPKGHIELMGLALYYGTIGQFPEALHLLIPSVESTVRFLLKLKGVKTVTLNQEGIEDEVGLSALVAKPEFTEIFGEDLAFEIKALFTDHKGPNLRNNIAHGIASASDCGTIWGFYAWWLWMKIIFKKYLDNQRTDDYMYTYHFRPDKDW